MSNDSLPASRKASIRHGYCAMVVSEGVRKGEGQFLSDTGLRDAFGHAQLGGVAPVIAGRAAARFR